MKAQGIITAGILLMVTWLDFGNARPSEKIQEKFDMNILEHGTKFKQEVGLDEAEHIVTVHVPAHNDVDETYFITDTIKHLTMRVAPKQKMCFLTENDPEELPSAEVWRKTRNIVQDSSINSTELQTRNIIYQTHRRLSPEQRTELPIQMKRMCENLPVMRASPVDVSASQNDQATFSKENFTIIELPKREKRHANGDQSQSDNAYVEMCPMDKIKQKCLLRQHGCNYAYDRVCDAHVDVNGRESMQCNLGHWSGQVICCKPCCLDQVPEGNPSLHCYDDRLHRDAICD